MLHIINPRQFQMIDQVSSYLITPTSLTLGLILAKVQLVSMLSPENVALGLVQNEFSLDII